MPEGIYIVVALFLIALLVAIVLPMAQRAAGDPFVDVPAERRAYVEKGQALYNKFSDTNDVTKGNFLRTVDPGEIASGDADLAEASRTSVLTPDSNAPTGMGVRGNVPEYRIPPPNAIMEDAKRCEAKKGRGACAALGTPALKGCGVCIAGGSAYLDPDNPGKHIGGLVLLPEDREMAEEEAQGTGKAPAYMPTVGECPAGFMFVDSAACMKAVNRQDCKEIGESGGFDGGRTIEGRQPSSCAAAPSAGDNVYVYDTKDRMFTLNMRFLAPARSGPVSVSISSGGVAVGSGGGEGGKEFVVSIKNVKEASALRVEVDLSNAYVPYTGAPEYRAVLIQYESVDGRRLGRVEPSLVGVNGQSADADGVFKVLRKYGTFSRSSIILLPRPGDGSKILTDTQWLWGAGGGRRLALDMRVPGTFLDPVYSEDKAIVPSGPLIAQKSTFELLRAGPCMKPDQKPGKYSLTCLKTLLLGAGGDPYRGTLARDGLEKLNKIGDGSAETISKYLSDLFTLATRGKTEGGMKASITEINDAAMKMFGFEIVSPCEDILENERGEIGLTPKMGGVDADCLDYLWTNTGNDRDRGNEDKSRNTTLKNTYTSIFNRYSGLRTNEGTKAEVEAAPFAACQRSGTLAPKDSKGAMKAAAVLEANKLGSIPAIQDFYNSIHKTANYMGKVEGSKEAHEAALLQCYGIPRSGSRTLEKAACPRPSLLPIGARISLSPSTNTYLYARHAGFVMWTHGNDGSPIFRNDATFKVVPAIGGTTGAVSLESVNYPGYCVVHWNFRIQIFRVGANQTFNGLPGKLEADWILRTGVNNNAGQVSFEAKSYGTGWYIGKMGDQIRLVQHNNWNSGDLSWVVQPALA
jgi:hypothetical protein